MRAVAVTLGIALAAVAGCGSDGTTHAGAPSCGDAVGVALVSWTIGHQPPTADQGCVGVDHLLIDLRSDCNEIQIDPIPCISGVHWRYDSLPAGKQVITLFAIDGRQQVLARGAASATLLATVPAQPVAIDLE